MVRKRQDIEPQASRVRKTLGKQPGTKEFKDGEDLGGELVDKQFDLYDFVRILGLPLQVGPGEGSFCIPRSRDSEVGFFHADAASDETVFQWSINNECLDTTQRGIVCLVAQWC